MRSMFSVGCLEGTEHSIFRVSYAWAWTTASGHQAENSVKVPVAWMGEVQDRIGGSDRAMRSSSPRVVSRARARV